MPAPEAMENAVKFYQVLAVRAQRRAEPITYKGLAIEIGRTKWDRPFSASLYVIAAHLRLQGLPPLTILVVPAKGGGPQDWLIPPGRTLDQTLGEVYDHPWDPGLFDGLLT